LTGTLGGFNAFAKSPRARLNPPKDPAALEAMRLIVKDVATSTDNGLLPGPGDDEMMAFSAAAEPDAAAEPEPVKAATTRKRKAQQEEA